MPELPEVESARAVIERGALGRRIVVIDSSDARIDDLELDSYRADVPGLVGDVRVLLDAVTGGQATG